MSDSEPDDEFETWLKRNRPIQTGSKPPEQEPPPELDRIVIGNARKAIQGSPPAQPFRAPKWALPTALATTILISFAILLDLSVRAQRAEHEKQALPAKTVQAPAGTAATQAGSAATYARPAAGGAQPPPIPTAPWPPLTSPPKVALADGSAQTGTTRAATETARTRLARVEVATTRSRASEAAPDPAAWAAQIEKLRSEGQTAEVEQETKRFRETYPSYALPADAPSTDGRTQ